MIISITGFFWNNQQWAINQKKNKQETKYVLTKRKSKQLKSQEQKQVVLGKRKDELCKDTLVLIFEFIATIEKNKHIFERENN